MAPNIAAPAASANPPVRTNVNLATIVRAWEPAPQPQQRTALFQAGAVGLPPTTSDALYYELVASWQTPVLPAQGSAKIAPLIPPVVATSNPPAPSFANTAIILRAWEGRFSPRSAGGGPDTPAVLPDAPPARRTGELPPGVLASWVEPLTVLSIASGASQLAGGMPPVATAIDYSTAAAWQPLWWASQAGARIAPLLPAPVAPDSPPPSGDATLNLTIRSWSIDPLPRQRTASQAAFTVSTTPDAAPSSTDAVLLSIVAQWTPPWCWVGPSKFAPLAPAPVDAPPPAITQRVRTALDQWKTDWTFSRSVRVAAFVPPPVPPDNPPPTSGARYALAIRQWDPPVWWPLPEIVPSVQQLPLLDVRISYDARDDARMFHAGDDVRVFYAFVKGKS